MFVHRPRCKHGIFVIAETRLLKWHGFGTAVALTVMLSVDPSAIDLCIFAELNCTLRIFRIGEPQLMQQLNHCNALL